jgi:Fe2+ transport system protein FeoA
MERNRNVNTSFEQITEKKTLAELRSDETGIVTKLRGDVGTLGAFRYLGITLDAPVQRAGIADGAPDDYDVHVRINGRLVSLNARLARNIQVSVERVRTTVDVEQIMHRHQLAALPVMFR